MSQPGPAAVLHPEVMRHVARLGGRIPDDFAKDGWTEPTPVGERPVPLSVQALLSITWPDGHVLHSNDDDSHWLVTLPCWADGDELMDEPRAWVVVAYDESQMYWVVDLDDADGDDPLLYRADHEGGNAADWCEPLSAVLAGYATPGPPRPQDRFPRACAIGDLAVIREYLDDGVSLGPVDPTGLTPLHLAVVARSPEAVQALLDAGADPNARTADREPERGPWTYLDPVGHPALHQSGLDPEPGETPLHFAIARWHQGHVDGRLAIIRSLLAAGADPDARDDRGVAPLLDVLDARGDGAVEALRLLLAAGADPHAGSEAGEIPLLKAVDSAWFAPELLGTLLAAGADPVRPFAGSRSGIEGGTALHMAAGEPKVLSLMLPHVTDVNVRTGAGIAPVHCAAIRGAVESLRLLVEVGADPDARLSDPSALREGLSARTPLAIARELNRDEAAVYLADLGAR
ncbi:hypothetical protein GCM10023085_82050 [Actinomadura viridis]